MELTLQQILEAYSDGGTEAVRGALSEAEVNDEALASLVEAARGGFGEIYGDGSAAYSTEDAEALEQLAGVIEALGGEQQSRLAAAAATTERVQQLARQVTGGDGDEDGDDEADPAGEGDESPGEPPAEEPPATPPAPASNAPRRPVDVLGRLAAARSRTPQVPVAAADGPRISLVAAADVPNMAPGSDYADIRAVSMAAIAKLNRMPKPMDPGTPAQMRAGLAIIHKEFPEDLVAKSVDDHDVLDRAADESRLPGNSLVAAGGWCSPSETLYGFFELDDVSGILSIPESQWQRAGIKFTKGPDFSTIYGATGFAQTEAQAIADTPKTCYEVPCNTWEEVRLDLIGLCIKAGILMNASYPELIDRYIRGALTAHAHRVNASTIARVVALSTLVDFTAVAGTYWSAQGATSGTLEALELQVEDYRTKYRMAQNRSLEGVAPSWLRAVLRADLSKRNGNGTADITVQDAALDAHFRARGVNLQYVYDWQDNLIAGSGLGGATAATAWPATVDVLLYAAGTFVRGTNEVITLDAGIYDSVNIMTNKYNALFTEEGIAVAKRGFDSRRVKIAICASGVTAEQVDLGCA